VGVHAETQALGMRCHISPQFLFFLRDSPSLMALRTAVVSSFRSSLPASYLHMRLFLIPQGSASVPF
jgi:hypothetical protein